MTPPHLGVFLPSGFKYLRTKSSFVDDTAHMTDRASVRMIGHGHGEPHCRLEVITIMKTVLSLVLCSAIIGPGAGVVVTVNALWPQEIVLSSAEDQPSVNVHVKVLHPDQVEDVLLLTGRIDPWEERVISAEVAGKVEWQGIEEGEVFARGQEILKIDTAWYVAAHEQAQAGSELAAQELERMQGLKRGGVSSPQDLDRAVTQRKVASSDVVASSTQFEKAVARAPMAGVADKLYIKQNEWADRGQPLVRLEQIDKVKAIIGIPERDVSRLAVGDSVAITLDALPGSSFQAGDRLIVAGPHDVHDGEPVDVMEVRPE